jgi:chitin-binding protein
MRPTNACNTANIVKDKKFMKKVLKFAGAAGICAALTGMGMPSAMAHGSTQDPVSTVLACYKLGGSGNTTNAACNAAYNESSDKNIFYDWMGTVNGNTRLDADGKQTTNELYRTNMPDGAICSAGNRGRAGLNLAHQDWPSSNLPAGGSEFLVRYNNTVNHNPYTFSFYVTKDGYDPTKVLNWDDLEPTPFMTANNLDPTRSGENGLTEFPTVLPNKTGKHMILTIWQGNIKPDGSVQSNEAFVGCSAVNFS